MAKSVAEVVADAENLVDEVKEKMKYGGDAWDAISEIAHEEADSAVIYTNENWSLVNEFYGSRHYQSEYSVDYELCQKTTDVYKLLQETAYCIVYGIITTVLQEKIEDEDDLYDEEEDEDEE